MFIFSFFLQTYHSVIIQDVKIYHLEILLSLLIIWKKKISLLYCHIDQDTPDLQMQEEMRTPRGNQPRQYSITIKKTEERQCTNILSYNFF